MRRFVAGTVLGALVLAVSACGSGGLFGREYEYEEEIYLKVDGSATVVVNASLPALSALRGAPSFDDGNAGVDRDAVRRFFQSPVTDVTRVSAVRGSATGASSSRCAWPPPTSGR